MSELKYYSEPGKQYREEKLKGQMFYVGQCYLCGCWQHTRWYCPLRQCQICLKYGHVSRVCQRKNKIKKDFD